MKLAVLVVEEVSLGLQNAHSWLTGLVAARSGLLNCWRHDHGVAPGSGEEREAEASWLGG